MLQCAQAAELGEDFPSVWETVLRRHALVVGPPVQVYHDDLPRLEVHLITNQRIIYNSDSREYVLV